MNEIQFLIDSLLDVKFIRARLSQCKSLFINIEFPKKLNETQQLLITTMMPCVFRY